MRAERGLRMHLLPDMLSLPPDMQEIEQAIVYFWVTRRHSRVMYIRNRGSQLHGEVF